MRVARMVERLSHGDPVRNAAASVAAEMVDELAAGDVRLGAAMRDADAILEPADSVRSATGGFLKLSAARPGEYDVVEEAALEHLEEWERQGRPAIYDFPAALWSVYSMVEGVRRGDGFDTEVLAERVRQLVLTNSTVRVRVDDRALPNVDLILEIHALAVSRLAEIERRAGMRYLIRLVEGSDGPIEWAKDEQSAEAAAAFDRVQDERDGRDVERVNVTHVTAADHPGLDAFARHGRLVYGGLAGEAGTQTGRVPEPLHDSDREDVRRLAAAAVAPIADPLQLRTALDRLCADAGISVSDVLGRSREQRAAAARRKFIVQVGSHARVGDIADQINRTKQYVSKVLQEEGITPPRR